MPTLSDESEYALLVLPGAAVTIHPSAGRDPALRIQFLGNREGMASLANILLWLRANAYRREFLSLTALPFIRPGGRLAVTVRVSPDEGGGDLGRLRCLDGSGEFEWRLTEDDLQELALRLHYLASVPEHEYELLEVGPPGEARVEIRLSDARGYL